MFDMNPARLLTMRTMSGLIIYSGGDIPRQKQRINVAFLFCNVITLRFIKYEN
jgi:hypothetical protein